MQIRFFAKKKQTKMNSCVVPPMVDSWYSKNCFLTNRNTKEDLPTAESPVAKVHKKARTRLSAFARLRGARRFSLITEKHQLELIRLRGSRHIFKTGLPKRRCPASLFSPLSIQNPSRPYQHLKNQTHIIPICFQLCWSKVKGNQRLFSSNCY